MHNTNEKTMTAEAANDKSASGLHQSVQSARILWNSEGSTVEPAFYIKDRTWSTAFTHRASDGSIITVKAGNKIYSLSRSVNSEFEPGRVVASEAGLFKRYK